jgi:hypothetical protein
MKKLIWALFGNDEDGIYGDRYWNPEQEKSIWRAVRWWFRNPFHNLMFHVLSVPKPFTSEGDFPHDVFSPIGGWNRVTRTGANGKRYRFISYIGWCKAYIGWRERGNFGIKLTRNKGA